MPFLGPKGVPLITSVPQLTLMASDFRLQLSGVLVSLLGSTLSLESALLRKLDMILPHLDER